MSAEVLREAAALMCERAEAAGDVTLDMPWGNDGEQITGGNGGWMLVATSADPTKFGTPLAEHIASWHPAVARAVADWLETVARRIEEPNSGAILGGTDMERALAVARAYLGADS